MDRLVYNLKMLTNKTRVSPTLPARERILLTAHELFYRDGIRATGIDRVIAESGVTKVTFYRHFPSKNDLICEFLEFRHRRWMEWFVDALQRHGENLNALLPALSEWFNDGSFRGCAFINSVGELGAILPEVVEISRRHKLEMMEAIARLLPPSRHRAVDAQAVAMAIDGAIIRAQFDQSPEPALHVLNRLLKALLAK
ncbi:MAG: TetR/AcrR family transcriptional regulator [Thiobacillus sp.]|nr:TetR/AcrR family transcriptional regulator [Thiobacillus sp.]